MKPTQWMEEVRRVRRRRTAQEREAYLKRFASSGLSVAAFCREHGLCEQTLYNWRQRQRSSGLPVAPAAPSFAQVSLAPAAASAGPVCIHVGGDLAIEVAAGTDAGWLAQVVRALRAGP